MRTKESKFFFSRLSSWGLSILVVIFSTILIVIIAFLLSTFKILNNDLGEKFIYIFWDILIATACFFICLRDPKSFWYVPILCNIIGIISAVFEPTFWTTHLWILFSIGWGLSIIGAIIGIVIGRSAAFKQEKI